MELVGEFAAAGLVGAAGWRCWEHMGGSGGIVPDGLVYVETQSLRGRAGITLNTNGSARGRSRVERKMRGYASPQRINDWPVLMVVWDKEAEAVFQQVGEQAGVPMLTSTVDRIKKYRVVRRPPVLVHVWGACEAGLTGPEPGPVLFAGCAPAPFPWA